MTKGPLWWGWGGWQVVMEGDQTMNEKDNDPALMCLVYVLKYMYGLLKGRYCFNCVFNFLG